VTDVAGAVERAERLLVEARRLEPGPARRRRHRLARLLADPAGRSFTLALTDGVVRIVDRRRAARRFADLVAARGAPGYLGPLDRVAMLAGARLAPLLPNVVVPLVEARLRRESAGVILPAEGRPLARHLARRHGQGFRLNVNVLGEAILGDGEAARRLDTVEAVLRRPDVDYVSAKVSALCAQLDVLAFDDEVERIAVPLRRLYLAAGEKFVNLDMEEHRDLHLTAAVFRKVLDEPAHAARDAGIVLQAYLPESAAVLEEMGAWAAERHARTGGRIKVRIVKGANLAMEQVEAELAGWPQAPFTSKDDVDANYKRMLELALDDRWRGAVRVGVASHNLLDVAWALEQGDDRVELEMLEGMAEGEARAVRDAAGGLLLYAPVARHDDFRSAIAYLVRRLDENTGPDNFLRAAFDLEPGTPAWAAEVERFRRAVERRHAVASTPRRTQDRAAEVRRFPVGEPFANEPDTDWSIAANRTWQAGHLAEAHAVDERPVTVAMVDEAVAVARAAGPADRRALLHRCAEVLAADRGRLLAAMAQQAGKTIGEGDPEVSEAVDFARWYAGSIDTLGELTADGLAFEPYRVVVVASPWNFPLAIPAGGVFAALAAGSAVVLKPAPEAVGIGRLLAECCWEAGVPRDLLQLLPCADDEAGTRLVTHPDVDAVLLTGSYETAVRFLDWAPARRLHAETSGKNAIVVTAAADLDDAVRALVRSAFGHAGQKCSAASLGILEASVYDDRRFLRSLADAVASLVVGPATDLRTRMGPLIRQPAGPLLDALTRLDEGESWLVEPCHLGGLQWSPGVKLGVRPGSAFHLTECFGPVLGLLRADSLDHAIELQNAPAYGLTAGLQSLDPTEVAAWVDRVEAGNLYVNRHTTGAVVRRQPFGGWKRSTVGPTAKAGGPNHVLTLGRWRSTGASRRSMAEWWAELDGEHDPSGLRAERNVLRYRPFPRGVLLRVGAGCDPSPCLAAAALVGTRVVVSRADEEDEAALAARLGRVDVDRLRVLGPCSDQLRRAALAAGLDLDDSDAVDHGRIELLRWVREQAISQTMHRYGNVVSAGSSPP
jgi:RHH-type proline utilization regulon transcriptional repressor/proline dehydrogenase/delta 1-pyrroline-5-carboxylate dehydrogenase